MRVLNIAHRGARSLAPENTLAAIKKAWEIGADGVEIDVAVSKDEQLFLHHDLRLLRTTNVATVYPERANAPYTRFNLAELQGLDAGSWFNREDPFGQIAADNISFDERQSFTGLTIPTLEEALLFVEEKDWLVNIEIKKVSASMESFPVEQKILEAVRKTRIPEKKVIFSSFVHEYLHNIQRLCSEIEVQALIGDEGEEELDWGNYQFATYNANADIIDEHQIAQALENNCRVNLFTVNDPDKMLQFIKAGVSGIITDFPHHLQAVLQKYFPFSR